MRSIVLFTYIVQKVLQSGDRSEAMFCIVQSPACAISSTVCLCYSSIYVSSLSLSGSSAGAAQVGAGEEHGKEKEWNEEGM